MTEKENPTDRDQTIIVWLVACNCPWGGVLHPQIKLYAKDVLILEGLPTCTTCGKEWRLLK